MNGTHHTINRVLDAEPCGHLGDHIAAGGGAGLRRARAIGPAAVTETIAASGLRGRGGAGFPTGVKWRTVTEAAAAGLPTPVVVNAAEGEPGSFKDRALVRRNPFRVLEGALIAALAVGGREVVVAVKASFERERAILEAAIQELAEAGWCDDVAVRVVDGPGAYLFGEETALLEVVEGRQPFPRVTPPYRRGLDPADQPARRSASAVRLAGPGGAGEAPALVDNVETLANVAAIVANGPAWFRQLGTERSPGTIVCTVTGATHHHGVGEVPMGTPLDVVFEAIGGGPRAGRQLVGAISGVANPIVPASLFSTPASYEAMAGIGSGLGACGFVVFDDETDLVAVAHAASRFLAVESCGQCEPCKLDGLAIAGHLDAIRTANGTERDLDAIQHALQTVDRGARCSLARQQRLVVSSALNLFPWMFDRHLDGHACPECDLLLPIVDLVGGQAVLDRGHLGKQPDWTFDPAPSGAFPVDLLTDTPLHVGPPRVHEKPPIRDPSTSVPAGLDDPLHEVRIEHDVIRATLQRVDDARDDERQLPAVLGELRHHLAVHSDVLDRVVYPMLERSAGSDADAATARPRDELRTTLALVDELLAAETFGSGQLDAVTSHVRRHLDAEERAVLPMVLERLDEEHIAHLRDALAVAMKGRTP